MNSLNHSFQNCKPFHNRSKFTPVCDLLPTRRSRYKGNGWCRRGSCFEQAGWRPDRPISNLPFISKLIERSVEAQLTEHLDTHSLLNSHQSDFIKHHSTETVLLSIHDRLVQAINNQTIAGICLLDISAVFDTIDHSIL